MSDQRWRKRFLGNRPLAPETLMMGYGYDPFLSERSLKPPVFHTSTFVFRTAQDGKEFFELAYGLRQKRPNEEPGLIYSRINNPDLEMLEDRLAIWDEAEANLTFASGMAAISTTPMGLCAARLSHRPFGPGLRRNRFSPEEDLAAIRRDFGRVSGGKRDEGDGGGDEPGARHRSDRGDLSRDAGQSDQRPRRHRPRQRDLRRPQGRGWKAPGRHRRQYDARTLVPDAVGARGRSGRDVAHQICRRPFRSDRRRLLGRGGMRSSRSAACARSSARCAIPTPAGC